MSKKIVGSYKGKPIVEGDANTFTKNEILVNSTPVSIKVREGGQTKDIGGGNEGVCYYKFNSLYKDVNTLLVDLAAVGAKIGYDLESALESIMYSIYIMEKTEKGKHSAPLALTSDADIYAAAVLQSPIYAVSPKGQEVIDGSAKLFDAMSSCTPITEAEYKSLYDSL